MNSLRRPSKIPPLINLHLQCFVYVRPTRKILTYYVKDLPFLRLLPAIWYIQCPTSEVGNAVRSCDDVSAVNE